MRNNLGLALILTVGSAFLSYRQLRAGTDFLGGFAIGLLWVGVVVQWSKYFRPRDS